jgi:hypothetical protein
MLNPDITSQFELRGDLDMDILGGDIIPDGQVPGFEDQMYVVLLFVCLLVCLSVCLFVCLLFGGLLW